VLRLLGFAIGVVCAVLVVRLNLLDGGDISAVRDLWDALGRGDFDAAAAFLRTGAALKLGIGIAFGGVLGALSQYVLEHHVRLGRH
jgi:hypothetical protein